MRNKIYYIAIALLMFAVGACDPVEKRYDMGNAITADQLDISATPLVVNGKRANKVAVVNHSPVLSSWDYGIGVSYKMVDTVLMVLEGDNDIVFRGLNPDGTFIEKTISVNIEELSFPVPAEWGYLCGDGEKEWVWAEGTPWGNGGYLGSDGPAWWLVDHAGIEEQVEGEGPNTSMIFSISGASFTKKRNNGTEEKGSFIFDMSKQKEDNGNIWAIGQMKIVGTTVLCGISVDEGGIQVDTFDILELSDERMVLAYAPAGTGAWGPAYFWVFVPKN